VNPTRRDGNVGRTRNVITRSGKPEDAAEASGRPDGRRAGRFEERREGVPEDPRNAAKAFRKTQGTPRRRSGRPKERRKAFRKTGNAGTVFRKIRLVRGCYRRG